MINVVKEEYKARKRERDEGREVLMGQREE